MNEAEQRLQELEALITKVDHYGRGWPVGELYKVDYKVIGQVLRWFCDHLRAVAAATVEASTQPRVVCAGCRAPADLARSRHLDGKARCAVCSVGLLDQRIADLQAELARHNVPEWVIELNQDGRPRARLAE